MDIDVRLLRSFVSIFECGSLSRAAQNLACTQPAMSMRLKWLESELGGALFVRHHHKLEPTLNAREFYPRALVVIAAYDEMISATRNTTHRGKLRVGIPDDYAIGFLPMALKDAKMGSGQIEIEIVCGLSANLVAALARHEVDIAVVTLASTPNDALATIEVPLKWVMGTDYQHEAGQPVGLAAYPEGCMFRRAMIQTLDEAGIPWAVLAQSQNRSGIVAALRGELGVSAMAVGTVPDGTVELTESAWLPALPYVPISIVAQKSPSAEGRQLADAFARVLSRAEYSNFAA